MDYKDKICEETADIELLEITKKLLLKKGEVWCFMEGAGDDKVFYLYYLKEYFNNKNINIGEAHRKYDVYKSYVDLLKNSETKKEIEAGNVLFLVDKDYSDLTVSGWEEKINKNAHFFKTKYHSLENYFINETILSELLYYFRPNDYTTLLIEQFNSNYNAFYEWILPLIALFSINAENSEPNLKIDAIKIVDYYEITNNISKDEISNVISKLIEISNSKRNANNQIDHVSALHCHSETEANIKKAERIKLLNKNELNKYFRGKQALNYFMQYSGVQLTKKTPNKILSLLYHKNFGIPSELKEYLDNLQN